MSYILVSRGSKFSNGKYIKSILKKFAKDDDVIVASNDDGSIRIACGQIGLPYASLDEGEINDMASFQIVFLDRNDTAVLPSVFPMFQVIT